MAQSFLNARLTAFVIFKRREIAGIQICSMSNVLVTMICLLARNINLKENMNKYKLLTKFANNIPQAKTIQVIVEPNTISMKPRFGHSAYKIDADFIDEMLKGADSFLYFLEDYGYEIVKRQRCIRLHGEIINE